MAQLINIDFSGTITNDFNGATGVANYTGGDLQFTGEGFILAKTSVGTGNKWMRFKLVDFSENLFIGIGDSSGNLFGWSLVQISGDLHLEYTTEYLTYDNYHNNDAYQGIVAGVMSAGQFVGITFEISTNTIRAWANVTNAEPDSVSSWDSSSADASSTAITFKDNSDYVGFGCWTSAGSGAGAVDDFTAGDFSAGSATGLPRRALDGPFYGSLRGSVR